jgi:trehalose 6-phosphate phosphatase
MSQKDELLNRLRSSSGLLLLLDFDGTLVDIAPTPDSVIPPPELKIILRQLLARPMTHVAILSGRSLAELQEFIPSTIPVALAGCHGCELQMPGELEQSILDDEEIQQDLDNFAASLEELADWPGIIIEHKGCAVGMHYRLADETTVEHAFEEFYSKAEALENYEEMEIVEGKDVVELRPLGMNKGIAVSFLVENFRPSDNALIAYVGDDTTDLDGFDALPEGALRVAVGEKLADQADYVLSSPDELLELIRGLLQ